MASGATPLTATLERLARIDPWFGADVAALVIDHRLPDPRSPLWVREHDEGWFDRVAFERPGVLVARADAHAGHPDATVLDDDELISELARGLATRLEPVLDVVRGLTPFGRRGLWGGVADELASAALWAARASGGDPEAAWRTAVAITDAVAADVPWLRTRPSCFPVGETMWAVRGTCCLFHKTQPQPPDPSGESYCTTCPFRDEDSRRQRLTAHLHGT